MTTLCTVLTEILQDNAFLMSFIRTTCPTDPTLLQVNVTYLVMNKIYEAPHYVVFSVHQFLSLNHLANYDSASLIQIPDAKHLISISPELSFSFTASSQLSLCIECLVCDVTCSGIRR